MKFIRNNKYVIGFLVILLAICYAGYSYYQSITQVETTVKTAKVEYGTLKDSISATGSLSAVDNVDISSKITGRIVEVLVEENQHVEAGQVLVKLDATALEATARQMKARLDNAELTYNRYTALLAQGAISRSDYDWRNPIISWLKLIMTRQFPMLTIPLLLLLLPVTLLASLLLLARLSAPVSANRR